VLAWYDRHRRTLPWRALPGQRADPYQVWLSEIMLQQTTVAAVVPYFTAFVARWPSVEGLADAPVEEVMRQWAGLGYYSRARNLHACARMVTAEHGGRFPDTEEALRGLPGIGPYTAAAIAAIAFGRRAVVVDGNVERVVARLFAIPTPLPAAKASIRAKATDLTPPARPGDYAQAMMDLGATICTPRKPACALCPLTAGCAARATGTPERFPLKAAKPERPVRHGAVLFVRRRDGMVLVRTRPPKGLLGGMTEFPGTEWTTSPLSEEGLRRKAVSMVADFGTDAALWSQLVPPSVPLRKLDMGVTHVFTHFRLELEIRVAEVPHGAHPPAGCRWVHESDVDHEALPSVMRKVLKAVRGNGGSAGP
jgi:A/G-specific adenine glycosylase